MAEGAGWIRRDDTGGRVRLVAGGRWTVADIAALDEQAAGLAGDAAGPVGIDVSAVAGLDTAGVWLLRRIAHRLEAAGATVGFAGIAPGSRALFDLVAANEGRLPPPVPRPNAAVAAVERLGRAAVGAGRETVALTAFIGQATITGLRAIRRPRRFRIVSLANQIERTGLDALPIVGLMAFLIGIVLAYQGATQLRRFGAEIFTIDLMAVSILREIGVLLTAILIAGRSGSAFTAEIGTMKVNEEVAAMNALGLDPMEILVLPRIAALVIALPLLTLFADFVGLAGGAAMTIVSLDLTATQFLGRLHDAITPGQFMVGMVKAPVFAYLIAVVGCHEGLSVEGGAESVGRMTTRSVVHSIFLVIIADAVFSIMFSAMGI